MKKSWLDEDISGEKVSKRNKDKSKFPLLAEAKKDKASSSRDLTEEALLKSIQQTSDPLQAMLAIQIADRLEKIVVVERAAKAVIRADQTVRGEVAVTVKRDIVKEAMQKQ